MSPLGMGATNPNVLARFDCDLSRKVDRQEFKRNNLRFGEETYFQKHIGLTSAQRAAILHEQERIDSNTEGAP